MAVYGLNRTQWVQVFSAWGGWLIDGYTTIAYALLIPIISEVFFPASLGPLRLLGAFMGFATGAVARSFGSLILGNFLGDRLGRKKMLTLTIMVFTGFSASKGLIPGYGIIGVAAPVLLFIFLFIEGCFAGAEYGGGTTLAMESIPASSRNFIGSFVQSGYGTGYFVISLAFLGLSLALGKDFGAFGWRILFLSAIIPGILTVIIRSYSKETGIFEKLLQKHDVARHPVIELFREGRRNMAIALIITTGLLFINTATFSFYPSVMSIRGFNNTDIGIAITIVNLVSLFGVWGGGLLGNALGGRKRPLFIYAIIFTVSTYFIITFGLKSNLEMFVILFSIQAFLEAMIFSTLPAFLSEQFRKYYRTSAVGFSYNGGAIVGGFALSVIDLMSFYVGLRLAWLYSMYAFSILMIIGILLSRESWSKNSNMDRIDL